MEQAGIKTPRKKDRISDSRLKEKLEILYGRYNKKGFVDPDPLLFLYGYPLVKDRGMAQIYAMVNACGRAGHLLADPGKSSACKRSHLFLRWMVRKDRVDPGGWDSVSPACLVVPIDTHMYRIGSVLGFTRRKSADKMCALEITRGFRRLAPNDPVRYDFALTRFGIRQQFDMDDLNAFLQGP